LGLGDYKQRDAPTELKFSEKIIDIAAGDSHSLVLTTSGKLYIWGNNNLGQLGLGDSGLNTERTIPTLVKIPPLKTIAAGHSHTLAFTIKCKLYGWGDNRDKQLDIISNEYRNGQRNKKIIKEKLIPTLIDSFLSPLTNVYSGATSSLVLDDEAKLYSWGNNDRGQLGSKTSDMDNIVHIDGIPKVKHISVGAYHVLVLDDRENLYSWGWNKDGQLGLANYKNVNTPYMI
jgi:alpha-tubulin suppressor-like RCC1 family protein